MRRVRSSPAFRGEDVVRLAHEASDGPTFERELLLRLQRAIGFDVAIVETKGVGRAPSVMGMTGAARALLAKRSAVYERELAAVEGAAAAARGVAVDTEVLGVAGARQRAYHRELAAPVGGRSSLLAYARLRGRVVGGMILGRAGGFKRREIATVEGLLPAVAVALASFVRPEVAPEGDARLTPREREVLDYLCRGLTNREIARVCGSSPNTVRNQLARVFGKIGATTRAEAVGIALRGA